MVEKIDAHGHFYKSYLGPESEPNEYFGQAKELGVTHTIASPGPSPEYEEKGLLYRPCIWDIKDGRIQYREQFIDPTSGELIRESASKQNPYHTANYNLIDFATKNNANYEQKVHVMPLHHPLLDDQIEIVELIHSESIPAIKIHGIATFTGPEDVKPFVVQALKEENKPVVVHTDTYQGESPNALTQACLLNHPTKWAKWAIDNEVKVFITHGARLSSEAIHIINEHPNLFRVGISPDLLLMSESSHLEVETQTLIKDLLTLVKPEILAFDIDYGWNVKHRGDWGTRDWGMCERLEKAAQEVGLSEQQLKAIYFDNAEAFFPFK